MSTLPDELTEPQSEEVLQLWRIIRLSFHVVNLILAKLHWLEYQIDTRNIDQSGNRWEDIHLHTLISSKNK